MFDRKILRRKRIYEKKRKENERNRKIDDIKKREEGEYLKQT